MLRLITNNLLGLVLSFWQAFRAVYGCHVAAVRAPAKQTCFLRSFLSGSAYYKLAARQRLSNKDLKQLLTVQNVAGPNGSGERSPQPSLRTSESNPEGRARLSRVPASGSPRARRALCLRGLHRRNMMLWPVRWSICTPRVYYSVKVPSPGVWECFPSSPSHAPSSRLFTIIHRLF
ncbi:hypothetical protein VTO73DRAFT_11235 [Trametes versicolor]